MAVQPVSIHIGSSNEAGFAAKFSEVPSPFYVKWFGFLPTTYPKLAPVSAVRAYTIRRPYATVDPPAEILSIPTLGSVEFATYVVQSDDMNRWFYHIGTGQLRKITGGTGTSIATIGPFDWLLLTPPQPGDSLKIIRNSHTLNGAVSGTTLLKTAGGSGTPAFPSAPEIEGKFVLFFDGYGSAGVFNLTAKIVTRDGDNQLTLDRDMEIANSTGFVILDGDDAAQDLAGITTGAALQPLAMLMDVAPVFETGFDYPRNDVTPFQSPLAALGAASIALSFGTNTVTVQGNLFRGGSPGDIISDIGAWVEVAGLRRTITAVGPPDTPAPGLQAVTVNEDWPGSPPAAGSTITVIRTTVNSVFELTWLLHSGFAMPLVCLEFGVSASTISPFVIPAQTYNISWAHDVTQLDFHPSSTNGLYQALRAQILHLKTLIEGEGNTMKVIGIFINCADNDASEGRYKNIGANMTLIRNELRALLEDDLIPWIMAGPSAYGGTFRPAVYEQLAAMEEADIATGYFDTREGYGKAEDGLHYNAAGQLTKAQGYFDNWTRIVERIAATPPPPVDEPSLTVTSAQEIVDIIDKAIAENAGVASYSINGRVVQLQGLDSMLRARAYYVGEVNRKKGIRRTLARFN